MYNNDRSHAYELFDELARPEAEYRRELEYDHFCTVEDQLRLQLECII